MPAERLEAAHYAKEIVPVEDSVDLIGKHCKEKGCKEEKKVAKRGKHKMSKAEMNAELFDDRRELPLFLLGYCRD